MKIKELIFDAKESTVYCESFVYEPSNIEEEKLGHLFMIGRIKDVPESSFYILNLLASKIKREYYHNYQKPPPQSFEKALKEGNQTLKENEQRIDWAGNLDFFIAANPQNKIYFTSLGRMKSFILRKGEIIDTLGDSISERDVLFPFSTILNGEIKKEDFLIFSTSNIFSKEKLIKFGGSLLPIDENKISKFIESEGSGVSLVVEPNKDSEKIERISQEKEKKTSVQKLSKLTLKHKENICQKIIPFCKNSLKKHLIKIKETFKKIKLLDKKNLSEVENEKMTGSPENLKLSPLSPPLKKTNPFFKRLSRKEVIISFIALLIIFGLFLTYQKNEESNNLSDEKILNNAISKKEQGENSLIYGDKNDALLFFKEGLKILENIENSDKNSEKIKNLKGELTKNIEEISGKKILSDLNLLFELKKDAKKSEPNKIILSNKNIYVFLKSSKIIYKWNLVENEGLYMEENENIIGGTFVNGKSLFITDQNSAIIDEEKKISFSSPYEKIQITDVNNFENYFYIFDSQKGEIIKYELLENEISSPDVWFREREAGMEGVSVAIDGNIFLALKNGTIKKYSAGSLKEEFNPADTNPEVEEISKIFTSKNNNYLYLAEPKEERIIVLSKKGKLISEYQNSDFKKIKDLWVDNQDKNIYVLSGRKVYKIPLVFN